MDLSDLPPTALRLIRKAEIEAEFILRESLYSPMAPKLDCEQADAEPEPDEFSEGQNRAALHLFDAAAAALWERVQPDLDALKTRLHAARKWVDDKFHADPSVVRNAAARARRRARREVATKRTGAVPKRPVLGVLGTVAMRRGQALREGRLEGYEGLPSVAQPFVPHGLSGVAYPIGNTPTKVAEAASAQPSPGPEPPPAAINAETGFPRPDKAAERRRLRGDYKAECKARGVRVTDSMIAEAASTRWHSRTQVQKWLQCDPKYEGIPDRLIRAVFVNKPHIPRKP
ncbi:MAG: hypothetical protein ABSH47_17240 [Bryobacteraceae bacterium]|jgi:hypothetical protein